MFRSPGLFEVMDLASTFNFPLNFFSTEFLLSDLTAFHITCNYIPVVEGQNRPDMCSGLSRHDSPLPFPSPGAGSNAGKEQKAWRYPVCSCGKTRCIHLFVHGLCFPKCA